MIAIRHRTITETLRQAIKDSGKSMRLLAKESGVDRMSLTWFMEGRSLHAGNIDKLAEYFGLVLVPKKKD